MVSSRSRAATPIGLVRRLHSPHGQTYSLANAYLVGVILSTAQNPTNFANFTQAVDFFSGDLPGNICFPVDFGNTNISGLQDGANVTVQMVFDAGDGRLYQACGISARIIQYISTQLAPLVNSALI